MEQARIMIVEDESIVAKDLVRRLQSMGYTVPTVVPSGAEAVQHAVALRPDLILMDINLRGEMDGIEAATQVRAQSDIPIIYLTAYADEPTLARAKVTEPFGYVLKPLEERELQITIEIALHKHRMEKALEQQRTDFLAMLTHDIRNPLAVILVDTHLLLEMARERSAAEEAEMIERVERNACTIQALVTNYLQLLQIEDGQVQIGKMSLGLHDLVKRVVAQHEGEARARRIALQCFLPETLPAVEGDALALERVLANLLNNALKFTPEQGQVIVSVACRDGEVVVSVADTGPGIAPAELTTVFEKYKRTRAAQRRQGVGLGLFIVKSLVEAHEGRVEVTSTLGVGTCFSVCLPVASAHVPDKVSEQVNGALTIAIRKHPPDSLRVDHALRRFAASSVWKDSC